MPAMKYLRFYLDRDCVLVPGWGKTKKVRKGCEHWDLADTKRYVDFFKGNAKLKNGTGGLLVIDVDPKNGGSIDALRRRFPDLPETRMVQTVTPHPNGFGTHLIFSIPADVRPKWRGLGPGIDVPPAVMLPGSVVACPDRIERTYELLNDLDPAPASLTLLAVIDKGEDSGIERQSESDYESDEPVHALVRKFAEAGPGERNEVFLRVAPPVIRLKGHQGAALLREAYTGDDPKTLEIALRGALQKYAGAAAPNMSKPSKYLAEALQRIEDRARYEPWTGPGGATDRRVLLAILRLCRNAQSLGALASVRTLSLFTGLEPKTVSSATARLVNAGLVCVLRQDDNGTEYGLVVPGLTTVPSKGESPLRGFPIDPLDEVWLSAGLSGRHSQVFDLVSVGICSAKEISTAGGMAYSTVRSVLSRLVEVGLLGRNGTAYTVAEQAEQIAEQLSMELGGLEKYVRLADRIEEERARPRGDEIAAAMKAADDDRRRQEEEDEQELMRWLGIL
jgi:DNA-binding transcriptional ArsR family regulator